MENMNVENNTESYKQERLHLRLFEDTIDVLYRPNHNYLLFLNNDEDGRKTLIKLAKMSRDEFKEYLKTITGLHRLTKDMMLSIQNSKAEEWYQGAWKMQTDHLFKELGIENPIEEPIYFSELINEDEI